MHPGPDYEGGFTPSETSVITALNGPSNAPKGGRFCPSKWLSIQENNFILPHGLVWGIDQTKKRSSQSPPSPDRAPAAPHAKSLRSLPAKETQDPSLQI